MRKDGGSGLPVSPWEDIVLLMLLVFVFFTLLRMVW